MGACISRDRTGSKLELSDINSNIYRVVNVDDDGVALWSGQLGITRVELTLYRKGKDPTRWPLKCLRRYGYDADLFSFEAGRRCTTGEGIYAFRCRRAENLFQTLQNYIQLSTWSETNRGSISGSPNELPQSTLIGAINSNSVGSSSYILANSQPHQQLNAEQSDSLEANYLEPIPNTSPNQLSPASRTLTQDGNNTRLNSVGSAGEPLSLSESVDPHSPGSPNSINNILEVTSLNPLPTTNVGVVCNGVSNLYQEFQYPERGESNNNKESKRLSLDIPPQEAAPSARNMSTTSAVVTAHTNGSNGLRISGQVHVNNNKRTILVDSPTADYSPLKSPMTAIVDGSESAHMYMNVAPGELNATSLNNKSMMMNGVDGCSSLRTNNNHIFKKQYSYEANHCYENLEPDDIRPFLLRQKHPPQYLQSHSRISKSDNNYKVDYIASPLTSVSVDKTSEPNTPTNPKFNYIVLDLDRRHSNSFSFNANNGYISPAKTTAGILSMPNGYAQSTDASGSAMSASVIQTPNDIYNGCNLPNTFTVSSFNSLQLLPPESPKKGIFDYATIDFNKTVALSNSTTPSMDCEGSRKTRHSSSAINASINTSHHNSISD